MFELGTQLAVCSGRKSGLTGHIAFDGRPVNLYGPALTEHFAVNRKGASHTPSGACYSLLAVPLISIEQGENRLQGLIRADNKRGPNAPESGYHFTRGDEFVLQMFADSVRVAIASADTIHQLRDMHQKETRRAELYAKLDDAIHQLRPAKALSALEQELVNVAGSVLGYRCAQYYSRSTASDLVRASWRGAVESGGCALAQVHGTDELLTRFAKPGRDGREDRDLLPEGGGEFEPYGPEVQAVAVPVTDAGERAGVLVACGRNDLDIDEDLAKECLSRLATTCPCRSEPDAWSPPRAE